METRNDAPTSTVNLRDRVRGYAKKLWDIPEYQMAIPIEEITSDDLLDPYKIKRLLLDFTHSDKTDAIINKIIEVNNLYGNSWAQDGIFINIADIKDKLTRLDVIYNKYTREIQYTNKTMDNYQDIIVDLFVRCLLILILDREIEKYVEENF